MTSVPATLPERHRDEASGPLLHGAEQVSTILWGTPAHHQLGDPLHAVRPVAVPQDRASAAAEDGRRHSGRPRNRGCRRYRRPATPARVRRITPIPRPARLMTLVRRFLAAVRDLTPIDVLPRKTTR